MKSLIYSALFSLVAFTLTSCDPGETVHYKLYNNSDYSVKVNFRDYKLSDGIEVISSKSESEFYYHHQIGRGKDYGDDFLYCFDTISFTLVCDTMKIVKDYLKRENWEFNKLDPTDEGYEIEYKFILNNSDLEKLKQAE
jgi:hypothetical protein